MGMRYLLFVCSEGETLAATPEELDPTDWVDEMTRRGVRSFGEQLAPTEGARQALLRPFFDPAPSNGRVVRASEAHRAIARLAAQGRVRLLLTTNFDQLMEHALAEVGVTPQVISSASAIAGMRGMLGQSGAHLRQVVEEMASDRWRRSSLLCQSYPGLS